MGFYTIRVQWQNRVYDLFNNLAESSVPYALTWRVEPFVGTAPAMLAGGSASGIGANSARPIFRVMRQFVDVFGQDASASRLAGAYDIDGNGLVDVGDLAPVMAYWMNK